MKFLIWQTIIKVIFLVNKYSKLDTISHIDVKIKNI